MEPKKQFRDSIQLPFTFDVDKMRRGTGLTK